MKDKLVRDVMSIGVPACEANCSLNDVAHLLSEEERDVLVVMSEGNVKGVVSQSDLARVFLSDYRSLTAQDIMCSELFSVTPDVSLTTAVQLMLKKGVHQVLVMRAGSEGAVPAGVLSKRHLVELMIES